MWDSLARLLGDKEKHCERGGDVGDYRPISRNRGWDVQKDAADARDCEGAEMARSRPCPACYGQGRVAPNRF